MATAPNLSSLNVVYRPQPAAHQTSDSSLLELSLAQTNSQGLFVPSGSRSGRPGTGGMERPSRFRYRELRRRTSSASRRLAPRESHCRDSRSRSLVGLALRALPRVSAEPLPGDRIRPLLDQGEVVGIVNICRLAAAAYQPREVAFLRSLSLPWAHCWPIHGPRKARIRSRRAFAQTGRPQTPGSRQRTPPGQLPVE